MKTGDKVVCIAQIFSDVGNPVPIKGEIYTYDGAGLHPDFPGYIHLAEFTFRAKTNPYRISYDPKKFRPVDYTFGEVVAEIIEKQVEVEQMETV